MATVPRYQVRAKVDYPTSDGKPMAETEVHRDDMMDLIQTLQHHFADEPAVCVSGNMLMFYEQGNRHKHVAPDVFVVRGVLKRIRENYLVWEEGKGPDLVIELTSKTTRSEDEKTKKALYQDVLKVAEYVLFDPREDYLRPSLQGNRLAGGAYQPIEPVANRLLSSVLGLTLGREGTELRLFDPATGRRLPTPRERAELAEAESERLRRELEALRRGSVDEA